MKTLEDIVKVYKFGKFYRLIDGKTVVELENKKRIILPLNLCKDAHYFSVDECGHIIVNYFLDNNNGKQDIETIEDILNQYKFGKFYATMDGMTRIELENERSIDIPIQLCRSCHYFRVEDDSKFIVF